MCFACWTPVSAHTLKSGRPACACDASVPTGAKFETFLYADRILGLELAREIGQPRD
jgi:hypothetical protein